MTMSQCTLEVRQPGIISAIYATRAHVEAEAGKHRPSTVGWINPRVVKLGVIE